MNLPNIISCTRILMVPLFVYFYVRGSIVLSMLVLLLCGLSDVLDGMIARRFNMITELGKILDPVADKLIQGAMMLCLAYAYPVLWLLLGLHAVKELSLGAMGIYVIKNTGTVACSKWYGKLCTVFIYGAMLVLLLFPGLGAAAVNVIVLCCAALMLMCMVLYMAGYMRLLKA